MASVSNNIDKARAAVEALTAAYDACVAADVTFVCESLRRERDDRDVVAAAALGLANAVGVGADKTRASGIDDFGALGRIAQDEQWFLKARSFFLDAAAVGDDQPGAGEQMNEVAVAHRRGEIGRAHV